MILSQLSKDGEYMNIGSRIYYEKSTGNVILRTPEVSGGRQSTVEEDFVSFTELNQRIPETIGMIQFGYKQHEQDFSVSVPTQVVNGQVLWTLLDAPAGSEPLPQKSLTEQITELKQRDSSIQDDQIFIMEVLAVNNLV